MVYKSNHAAWFLQRQARGYGVALEAAIATADTMPHLVGRAHSGALAIAGQLDSDALDEELANMLGAAASAAASAASSSDSTSEAPTEAEEEEEKEEKLRRTRRSIRLNQIMR